MRNKLYITLFCLAAALWHIVLGQTEPSQTTPCHTKNGECDVTNGLCWGTGEDSHFCTCNAGYEKDSRTTRHNCIDTNECNDNPCGDHADCLNTRGSFECKCHCGYIQDYTGLHCLDALEIEGACEIPESCVSKDGSYRFLFGGLRQSVPFSTLNSANYYTDYTQFRTSSTGRRGWLFQPRPPRRTCSCEAGFEFNSCGYCVDKNECRFSNPCRGFNSRCVNTEGSYYCTCDNGYILGPCNIRCYRPNDSTMPQLCGESNLQSLEFTGFSYRTWNQPIFLRNYRNCSQGTEEGETTVERHNLDFNRSPDIILTWVCSTDSFSQQRSILKKYAEAEAYWEEWSCWTACKATCWGGLQTRVRMCKNGLPGNEGCEGKGSEKKECYTGKKCAYRVRKDATKLTRAEQNDLLQAMRKYKADMTARGFHNAASAHGWPFQCDRQNCCPHGAQVEFLSWHRTIMLNYEEGLSRYMRNKKLGIPYWNWLSSNKEPPALGWDRFFNRQENPFANMTVLIGQTGPMRTIQRTSPVNMDNIDFAEQTWREVALEKVRPYIMHEFAESFESAHGGPHVSVCGEFPDKCIISLANLDFAGFDPLFMMHHSQVDRLWAVAQGKMEAAGEETWTTQSALQSLEPDGNFGRRQMPFGNTTLNPFPKVQAVNTMRDSYYYKELTGIDYDDLKNDGYPDNRTRHLAESRHLRPAGVEALFVGHYFQSDRQNFYVNYYADIGGPTACNRMPAGQRLGGALRLGTSRPFRLTIPHLVQISRGRIPFLDEDFTIKACYTADLDCRESCPELSTTNIRSMPDPNLVYYIRNTPVDIYKFQWDSGKKMPNWYINLDARSQWIYFFGARKGNIRQVQRGSEYLACNGRRGARDERAFDCASPNGACVLPSGIYYLIDSDRDHCRAGLRMIVVSRMDN